MSQENVDVYFAAKDRLAAGDHDGFARLLHRDVVATVTNFPEPGPFVGRDALVAQLERLGIEFDGQRYADVDIIADRDDWIVLTYRWLVRGSRSGVGVDADIAVAFRVKDRQLVEVHWRESRDEALEAAGLGEQASAQPEVELVRSVVWDGVDAVPLVQDDAAWARWIAGVEKIFEPDCAFAWIAPGQRVDVTGLDAFRRFLLDWFKPWDSVYADIEQILPVDDKVVMVVRHHGRMGGDRHDAEIEQIFAGVYHVRDGKVPQVEFYTNRAAALEAARMRQPTPDVT